MRRFIGMKSLLAAAIALAAVAVLAVRSSACPFCSAVSQTVGEEIAASQAAVLVERVVEPGADKKTADQKAAEQAVADPNTPVASLSPLALDAAAGQSNAKFRIVKILKGEDKLGKTKTLETLYFGNHPANTRFMVIGIGTPDLMWSTPTPLSDRAVAYVEHVATLAKAPQERLPYFMDYLEDADQFLGNDAYDEFGKVPYKEIQALKAKLPHDKLIAWIKDPKVAASHRRLYFTMLGVCGSAADLPMLEELLHSEDPQMRTALDALIACYLQLKGPDGMKLVEDLFLKNNKAEYTDTYAAVMALRFHGQESTTVPRERLMEGMRYILDRPELADLVITDLARWQDWSVVDKLVDLFHKSDEKTGWVRVPVINYLRACPLPEAKTKLDELAKLDPESFRRASQFYPLGAAIAQAQPAAASNPTDAKPVDGKTADSKLAGGYLAGAKLSDKVADAAPALVPPPTASDVATADDPSAATSTSQVAAAAHAASTGAHSYGVTPQAALRATWLGLAVVVGLPLLLLVIAVVAVVAMSTKRSTRAE